MVPALEIQHEDKDIALGVDVPSLAVGGRRHRGSDVTVLVEPSGVQRVEDTLPEAAMMIHRRKQMLMKTQYSLYTCRSDARRCDLCARL